MPKTSDPLPPHDADAERAVIASLLVAHDYEPDFDFLSSVPAIVQSEDFHGDRERWAYEAIMELHTRGDGVNQITVGHELARRDKLEPIGGATYLSALTSDLPTAIGCEHYARIVRRCAVYRRAIQDAGQAVKTAYGNNGDIAGFLDHSQSRLDALREMAVPVLGLPAFEKIPGDASLLPLPFVLHPHVVEGGGTILFGPPGKGKSTIALLWAVSVDSGCEALWAVEQTPTIVVNLERSERSIMGRLGLVNRALGLDENRPLAVLNARGKSLAQIEAELTAMVGALSAGFVILDSISRSGFGKMVEDVTANLIIDTLNRACPTWAAVGHTPRGDDTHSYGSVMFEAGEDVGVQLVSQAAPQKLGIGLQMVKANDMALTPMEIFALEFSPLGLKDVRRAKLGEFPELSAGQRLTLKEEVYQYLVGVGKDDATNISEETGRNRQAVVALLRSDHAFVAVGKEKRRVQYAVRTATLS